MPEITPDCCVLDCEVLGAEIEVEPEAMPLWLCRPVVLVLELGEVAPALIEPEPEAFKEPEPLRLPDALCVSVLPLVLVELDGVVLEVELESPGTVIREPDEGAVADEEEDDGLDVLVPELTLEAELLDVSPEAVGCELEDDEDCACSVRVAANSAAVPEAINLRGNFMCDQYEGYYLPGLPRVLRSNPRPAYRIETGRLSAEFASWRNPCEFQKNPEG